VVYCIDEMRVECVDLYLYIYYEVPGSNDLEIIIVQYICVQKNRINLGRETQLNIKNK